MKISAIYVVMAIASFLYIEGIKSVTPKRKNLFGIFMMTCIMFINFMTNDFNPKNTAYSSFQSDSESLVVNLVNAKNAGVETGRYGLGWYYPKTKNCKSYISQYGLQGKIFQFFYKVPCHHAICSIFTAFVFALLSLLIAKKYDKILGACFFITFLLSPWIVNFARNLYWVEFTWFIPMLIGLVISFGYEKLTKKILCYVGIFIAILIKCLCGYEYITVVMLAEISFPLIDFFVSLFEKDKKRTFAIFKTIIIMGIVSLVAFIVAIAIHANIRGEGNVIEGMKSIYKRDVLRRTLGGNFEDFAHMNASAFFRESFESSIIKVLLMYQKFSTEIVAGISGRLFMLLELMPILIFIHQYRLRKLQKKDVIAYIVFGITCVSWFVLGKSHSYIHTHMNYVLWYFGFIQICFYVIVKQVMNFFKEKIKFYFKNREEVEERFLESTSD